MKLIRLTVILYLILSCIYRNNLSPFELFGAMAVLVAIEAFYFWKSKKALNLILLIASSILLLTISLFVLSVLTFAMEEQMVLLGCWIVPFALVYTIASLIETFTKRKG